jgi:type II restriction/modification system DNA methylase subunit YeeA
MQGPTKGGTFEVEGAIARSWLKEPLNPNSRPNSDVLKLWANGDTITGRSDDLWIVDFATMLFEQASLYEKPFAYIERNVREARSTNVRQRRRDYWWQYNEPAPGLRKALEKMRRFIVTPEVSKHRVFTWLQAAWSPDKNLVVILRDDDVSFGLMHSKIHEIWALRQGTSLEDRPRYTSSRTYRTFPFPKGLTPNIPAADYAADPRARKIAAAAARLNELRENWLNPADLVVRVPEVVPGYPDRILPKDDAAAAILKKRTLTNLYNERPAWLDHAHAALDEAVAEAYGWGEDWRAGNLTEDEILARLFRLNQERAAIEADKISAPH